MKFGYQQGDRLAYWWIDHYVDVSDEQEPATRAAIARFFAWHRQSQLPEITAVLTRVKGEVQRPVDAAMIRQVEEDSQRLARQWEWLGVVHKAVDSTPRPSREQIIEMLRRYADHWQNPPDKARAQRYEANNEAGVALTVTIANLTTPQQKARAAERFQGWIEDTRSLARDTKSTPDAQASTD